MDPPSMEAFASFLSSHLGGQYFPGHPGMVGHHAGHHHHHHPAQESGYGPGYAAAAAHHPHPYYSGIASAHGFPGYHTPAQMANGGIPSNVPSTRTSTAYPLKNLSAEQEKQLGEMVLKYPPDYNDKRKVNGKVKNGTKGRKSDSPEDGVENGKQTVYVFDLSEVLCVTERLYININGRLGTAHEARNNEYQLATTFAQFNCNLAENYLFYKDLEECDQVNVDDASTDDNMQDLSNYSFQSDGFHDRDSMGMGGPARGGVDWMRKMAFRYRAIKDIYSRFSSGNDTLNLRHQQVFREMQINMDKCLNGWIALAKECLDKINNRENTIVCVCSRQTLVMSISNLITYGLADRIPIENIYSAVKIGKKTCYERIQQKFGNNASYVIIGDAYSQAEAAQLKIPFYPVDTIRDLNSLSFALDQNFL